MSDGERNVARWIEAFVERNGALPTIGALLAGLREQDIEIERGRVSRYRKRWCMRQGRERWLAELQERRAKQGQKTDLAAKEIAPVVRG